MPQATSELYYVTADGTPPAASTVFEAPQLKTLFSLVGTQDSPVKNVTFSGITFQGSAYTYMDVSRCMHACKLQSIHTCMCARTCVMLIICRQ